MADFVNTILLNMKANTTQARAEIDKLSGAQKDAAKEVLKAQEQQNTSLQAQILTWGKSAGAIGLGVAAYKLLKDASKEWAAESRLHAVTVGIDIDKIQKATMGLVTSDEALAFAAKSVTGAFKLTQEQMELVAKFSLVLRNRGFDLAEVQNALGDAFQTPSLSMLTVRSYLSSSALFPSPIEQRPYRCSRKKHLQFSVPQSQPTPIHS